MCVSVCILCVGVFVCVYLYIYIYWCATERMFLNIDTPNNICDPTRSNESEKENRKKIREKHGVKERENNQLL